MAFEVTMETETRDWLPECSELSAPDRQKLAGIAAQMPFVSDVSRSDLLLYVRCGGARATVAAHAHPHSITPVYWEDLTGRQVDAQDEDTVFSAFRAGRRVRGNRRLIVGGAPVIQYVWPIPGDDGEVVAALDIEANMVADVRQKTRSRVFQRAVIALQRMLLNGDLQGAESLSPFHEHDGILVVDSQRIIQYASGIATELYRRLGYHDSLVGRHLSSLDTGDQAMYSQVIADMRCLEDEFEEHLYFGGDRQLIWVRKAVPLIAYQAGKVWSRPWDWLQRRRTSVLFTIHDATEERRAQREQKIQKAMLHEVHHRVKNNLQTVAALLRMQMRRSKSDQVREALKDSVGRILSMAVVHEYLSRADHQQTINIREVTQRIVQEIRQGVLGPDKQIRVTLLPGNNLYLPARQATACALVINELLQNSVEHGYVDRSEGKIDVQLQDNGDEIEIIVTDDGEGLPADFDLAQSPSLGLRIVRTLAQDDLQGDLLLEDVGGVRATVRFSKQVWEAEGHWNEQE
jgi:two-component sensor histidine kinase/PAS domain-containing protein